jgi:hypothetical protein
MSRLSRRCARILRVRSAEHRAALAREAAAKLRIAQLLGVARRVDDLRASLRPAQGPCDGQSLHAMLEMQQRLGRAETDLARPIGIAEGRLEQASAARLIARRREDGAERLHDRAAAGEQRNEELREAANRPPAFTKRKRA